MTDFNSTLDALAHEIQGILKADESVPMTKTEFAAYCAEQIKLAKADTDPAPRLAALAEQVALAKAYTWENSGPFGVSIYSGELAVTAQSAHAERNPQVVDSEKNGQGMAVPGPQATPSGGAFEAPSGPTGPASNTARPAMTAMPPAFPQSEPAANAEGFIAKAEVAKSAEALLAAAHSLLAEEGKSHQEPVAEALKAPMNKDDGWPADLASESFLQRKPEVAPEEDFGGDPEGLGRGKIVRD